MKWLLKRWRSARNRCPNCGAKKIRIFWTVVCDNFRCTWYEELGGHILYNPRHKGFLIRRDDETIQETK